MAAVIILFLMLPIAVYSQCKRQFVLDQSVAIEGITNGIDTYYQNLIIQDIALAEQKTFREISLQFDFKVQYLTDQCRPGKLEIRVLPVVINSLPLLYQGFDISSSIRPERADMVFHLVQHSGFVTDSLVFFDIPLETDSSLYTSLTSIIKDTSSVGSVIFFQGCIPFFQIIL